MAGVSWLTVAVLLLAVSNENGPLSDVGVALVIASLGCFFRALQIWAGEI